MVDCQVFWAPGKCSTGKKCPFGEKMPLYDFACTECGTRFEKQIPFTGDLSHLTCPQGHRAVRRIYSAPQVVFKGSGWYSTDQRSGATPAASTNK
jgi:putative FmdB family regulatory protein